MLSMGRVREVTNWTIDLFVHGQSVSIGVILDTSGLPFGERNHNSFANHNDKSRLVSLIPPFCCNRKQRREAKPDSTQSVDFSLNLTHIKLLTHSTTSWRNYSRKIIELKYILPLETAGKVVKWNEKKCHKVKRMLANRCYEHRCWQFNCQRLDSGHY